jgi:hypothetical protein
MSNDETANSMQQKITKRQNERHDPEKVVVVKVNENNELDFVQGNTKNLTGKLKTQVIGHGARTNNVNTLEGRQGFEIAQLIKTLVHLLFVLMNRYHWVPCLVCRWLPLLLCRCH